MNYLQFNKKCYDYYIENNQEKLVGSFLIPPSEIVDWLKLDYDNPKISFVEINSDWWYLTNIDPNYNIPKAFGIIALQCYGAFLRHNTINTTDKQLNKAIESLLGFSSAQQLQLQFGDGYPNTQDQLWINAQIFLKQKEINISIPQPSYGPGRNVQYPKSQVFFTLQIFKDLYPILLNAEEQFISNLSEFRDFILLKLKENHSTLRNIKQILLNTENAERNRQVFIIQLFNFWRSSDWKNQYFQILTEKSYKKKINTTDLEVNFQIYFDYIENKFSYFLSEQNDFVDLNETNVSRIIEKGPILFTNSLETPFDFSQVNSFVFETPYLIYCKTFSSFREKLENFDDLIWFKENNISIAFAPKGFNDQRAASLFNDFSQTIIFNAIQFNAPKIDFRKNIVLYGHNIEVLLNLQYIKPNQLKLFTMIGNQLSDEIEFSPIEDNRIIFENLNQHKYCISSENFNDIIFEIADISFTNNINYSLKSFNIKDYRITSDLLGIHSLFYPLTNQKSNLSYKNVTRALLYKEKKQSDNTILKAINLSNHGRN
jgi:hypothetical protein